MSPGMTMERIYEVLKAQILTGTLAAGRRLDPARLAPELHASTTPVRDALQRLVGERLVETWPHEGFHVPILTEPSLRDLYAWNLDVARLILGTRRMPLIDPPPGRQIDGGAADLTAGFFLRIGLLSANFEHRHAIAGINDRLATARRIEPELFADHDSELAALDAALAARDRPTLQRELIRYHRRRIVAVPAITARLRPDS
ncbi:transcriptional regulator, GntR family [Sphingomonas laterariae]|uniref:Transcriptional regulator, GntR family n=1 Tax=Edaphosphingomonas laterariae TaxID=861865 RepID=A0A239I3Q1_9SPHN|nr:GntR family transcriptional regulator [Sphingomonas laterariae]SNS88002.1 transcriptional regulator, GntR family [Sphingomonas laterariae]